MRHNKKAVRCIETGKIYPSAVEASTAMGLNHMAVAISISKNCRSGGFTWEYVDKVVSKDLAPTAHVIFGLFQSLIKLVPMSETSKVEPLAKKFEAEMDKLFEYTNT